MSTTPQTSVKLQQHFWALEQMLPLRQSYLWSLLPPRSLFLLLKSPKGLARLVTKAEGEVAKGKGVGQGGSRPEDKDKGKEAKGPEVAFKPKDATPKPKDATPKAKEVDPKSKEADPKAIDPLVS